MKRRPILLSKRLEILLLVASVLALALIDGILYVVLLPRDFFADKIVSNWNPLHGEATFSLGTSLALFLNILIFVGLYASLRPLFTRLYRRQTALSMNTSHLTRSCSRPPKVGGSS
jgi:hypothetical protein